MRDSEIYRRAAILIDAGENSYCGTAILQSSRFYGRQKLDDFWNLFTPPGRGLYMDEVQKAGGKTWRVLALCLMAAICEEDGR